jgi:NAD(P)-dependent dehydrogenase (short-subunit alcohol dehydrogenase family)
MSRKRLALSLAVAGATTVAVAGTAATVGLGAAAFFAVRALRTKPLTSRPVVVITGGSRGLGLAIASCFARDGARLVLAARNRAELEQAQAHLLAEHPHMRPEDFYLVDADLTQPADCERLILEAIVRFSRIDILVNNAGIIEVGPLEAQPLEAFERAMRINFFAALYTTYAALPHMMAQLPGSGGLAGRRAAIINIASIGGKIAVPHMLPYSAAKFALVGFSEGLHAELRRGGVRVTTVCPGLMRSGGEDHARFLGDAEKEARWFKLAAKTPGLSASTKYAANRIYSAVRCGRAEITITPQAWLAARFAGMAPGCTQRINALVNDFVLPAAPGSR